MPKKKKDSHARTMFMVRLNDAERTAFREAATADGLERVGEPMGISGWLRMLAFERIKARTSVEPVRSSASIRTATG